MDNILLVDIFDREKGYAEKLEVHQKGILHRAFSVFIYSGNKMLLQRRNTEKYHSGGLLTNACCSHQRQGECLQECVTRRMKEEIGIDVPLKELFSFVYRTSFEDGLVEYELDHVFLGEYSGDVRPDPQEVSEVIWMDIDQLAEDLTIHPEKYTIWFLSAAPRVLEIIRAGGQSDE